VNGTVLRLSGGATLHAGKTKNIWFRPGGSELLWDGDLRPEGVSLTYKGDNYFVNTGLNFLESDSKSGNVRIAYGLQAGFQGQTSVGKVVIGASYFDIGTEDRSVFYGDDDDFFGNSFACIMPATLAGCEYLNDHEEIELFAELNTEVADRPIMFFVDYARNQDAAELDIAWAAGIKLGKASAPSTWELAWVYQDIEADAVFGLWTGSDFGGGGTDTRGHIFKGGWAINRQWTMSFTYFMNERNVDLGTIEDYDRLQIDAAFKF